MNALIAGVTAIAVIAAVTVLTAVGKVDGQAAIAILSSVLGGVTVGGAVAHGLSNK